MTSTSPAGILVIAQDGRRYLLPVAGVQLPRRAFRIREVGLMLGIGKSTVHDWVCRGDLRAVAIGKGRRKLLLIPAEEIERLLTPPAPTNSQTNLAERIRELTTRPT